MNRKVFFDNVRTTLFKGSLSQSQVDGLTAILNEWESRGLSDLRHLAYILGTVFHETARTMKPIKEYGSQKYLRSKPYYPWYGRGYVMLTWEENYRKMSSLIGVNLLKDPNLACRKDIALDILFEGMLKADSGIGDFTGKSLSDYFNDTEEDWVNARRIVNGTDKAEIIAGYGHAFLKALEAAHRAPGDARDVSKPIPVLVYQEDQKASPKAPVAILGVFALVVAGLLKLLGVY